MRNILKFSVILALFFGLFSCETMDDPEMKTTSTYPMNGEYWVKHEDNNGNVSAYHNLIITNTSADDGSTILINDGGTGYMFKSSVNMDNLTFSVENYQVNDTTSISVTNGQLLEDAIESPGEHVVTDSLNMQLRINIQGNVVNGTTEYSVYGYKYTGWPADIQ